MQLNHEEIWYETFLTDKAISQKNCSPGTKNFQMATNDTISFTFQKDEQDLNLSTL